MRNSANKTVSIPIIGGNKYIFCTGFTHIRYTAFTMHVANKTMNSTPEIHATPNFPPKVIKNVERKFSITLSVY